MWKPGQLVTLWGKVYRIRKCSVIEPYKVCYFCNRINRAPCINAYDYPDKNGFNQTLCKEKMPIGCYPQLIS